MNIKQWVHRRKRIHEVVRSNLEFVQWWPWSVTAYQVAIQVQKELCREGIDVSLPDLCRAVRKATR